MYSFNHNARTIRHMAAHDPERRRAAAAAGGRARKARSDAATLTASGRAGAAVANSPASLARRIVKAWPTMTRAERAEVRAILAPTLPRSNRSAETDQAAGLPPSAE